MCGSAIKLTYIDLCNKILYLKLLNDEVDLMQLSDQFWLVTRRQWLLFPQMEVYVRS